MIEDFQAFGIIHILTILSSVFIGAVFVVLAKKYPKHVKLIGLLFAITILAIRFVRYIFDIFVGRFEILDLLSIHICNINLYLLIFCLIKPGRNIFVFNYLVGIPTALAVVLMPGSVHPDPGLARAIFFIMSHMMLVMGAIYISIVHRYKITKKDLIFYYVFSFVGIILVYIFNVIAKANFMYLMSGPKGTILESMHQNLGPVFYPISIFVLMIILLSIFYLVYKKISNKIDKDSQFANV